MPPKNCERCDKPKAVLLCLRVWLAFVTKDVWLCPRCRREWLGPEQRRAT